MVAPVPIHEHDTVALLHDQPKDGLSKGDVGAVVHLYSQGSAVEVEFIDASGRTKCVATVPLTALMRLNVRSLSA